MLQARKKIARKELKKDPFFEKIDQSVRLYNQNKRMIYSLVVVLIVIAAAFMLYKYSMDARNTKAAAQFGIAQQYLDQGDFDSAESRLNELLMSGAGKHYKGLASYYLAYTAMTRQDYDKAKQLFNDYLNNYHNNDLFNQAALSGLGEIEEGSGNYAGAADYFRQAAEISESFREDFTLLSEAFSCYIKAGDMKGAGDIYKLMSADKSIAKNYSNDLKTLKSLLDN